MWDETCPQSAFLKEVNKVSSKKLLLHNNFFKIAFTKLETTVFDERCFLAPDENQIFSFISYKRSFTLFIYFQENKKKLQRFTETWSNINKVNKYSK